MRPFIIPCMLTLFFMAPARAFAWTRVTWGVEGTGGSVDVESKSAKESDKSGSVTSGGVLLRLQWHDLPGVTLGAGGAMFELSGRNKEKKFNQKYSAGTGYVKGGLFMEAVEDSGFYVGGEYWARFGKGAGFDFEMKNRTIGSAMAVVNYRFDDGYGWIPSVDVRMGNDISSGGRKVTFVMAGLSLVR